jgi:hypothetical protein
LIRRQLDYLVAAVAETVAAAVAAGNAIDIGAEKIGNY